MPYSDLTITRDDIDAFESLTFQGVNISAPSVLGLSESDGLTLDKAKNMLRTDVAEELREYINDGTYTTETALLNAIYDADTESLLADLLTYKFFELWFSQDATHKESYSYAKAGKYYRMYMQYLKSSLRRLSGLLPTPKTVTRARWISAY